MLLTLRVVSSLFGQYLFDKSNMNEIEQEENEEEKNDDESSSMNPVTWLI